MENEAEVCYDRTGGGLRGILIESYKRREKNMSTVKDTESAREFFKNDRYATDATGIEIMEARENYAKVCLKTEEKHQNAGGRVMGSVYFTMADFAFAVASNVERPMTFTLSSQISSLKAAKGDILFAEAKVTQDGKNTCFAECEVTDNLGTRIAVVTVNGYRMTRMG